MSFGTRTRILIFDILLAGTFNIILSNLLKQNDDNIHTSDKLDKRKLT